MAPHRSRRRFAALIALAACGLLGVSSSCERKKDVIGLGPWKLGDTKLAEAQGVCSRDDITFCSHNGTVPIGGVTADVNLYFRGSTDDAPLVEIELSIRRCDHDAVAAALIEQLGVPTDQRPARMYWATKHMHVTGKLPDTARECLVHFVDSSDTDRIAQLASE